MSGLDPFYDYRRSLLDALVLDTVGPAGGEREVISDAPLTRYVSGVLYPPDSEPPDPSHDVDENDGDEEGNVSDPPIALANRRYPSSMGMTFAVDTKATQSIDVHCEIARYLQVRSVAPAANGGNGEPAAADKSWQRVPLEIDGLAIDVTSPRTGDSPDRLTDDAQLFLFCRVRPADPQGIVAVTLVLLNREICGNPSERDSQSFFQPKLYVSAPSASQGAFVERRNSELLGSDEDIQSYRLLYRHAREFAAGHGCSVAWTLAPGSTERVTEVHTTFTPEYELPLADSNPAIQLPVLELRLLVDAPRDEILRGLHALCDGYESWIGDRAIEVPALRPDFEPTAKQHLKHCREALGRMRRGVNTLQASDAAWKAFRFANEAMLEQRARTDWLRNGRKTDEPIRSSGLAWRPFQLAFLLLCLEGIVDPNSSDRNLADLLWFPTGGGKTEAYLGLIAFTAFLRRLNHRNGGGVTALMRYTLRLLTIQQFERASLLICCCERIRAAHTAELGVEPISIGLWVGQDAVPNTREDTRKALDKLRNNVAPQKGNPVQLHSCPWCGAPLDHRNYVLAKGPDRLLVSCRKQGCWFAGGLPVYLIDEDVYDYRPTLIIATVDKFAGLPWQERAADLFNLATNGKRANPRPELIIQDELHLISGPLGTLVGLYETAVDLMCTDNGVRPKVIASTATIRRAQEQGHSLFERDVRQFPPPGLDARNSYFAVEAPRQDRGARLYVGLMAPGTSHTTLLVRTYAALLQKAAEFPAPDEVRDPYWTLVGYFNSLRVLGGARMQVQDDVGDRVALLARQSGRPQRIFENRIELTSREPSGNIPDHLKHMALSLPDQETLDVILATNMISVGVDIDRLGLMVVMGQPQGTSEYIQSTSRVGRRWPGLVVVLLNSARSRDRSHYESFVAYHSALYRQVEASSVTPFSARARDRGLHAVLVALARLTIAGLRSNGAADKVNEFRSQLEEIKAAILRRVQAVAPDEVDHTSRQIDDLVQEWVTRAANEGDLVYSAWHDTSRSLLVEASVDLPTADADKYFPTLRSLRDVDKESTLRLITTVN